MSSRSHVFSVYAQRVSFCCVATGSPRTNFTAQKDIAVLPRVLRVQTSQLKKISLCCHGFSAYKLHSSKRYRCVATGSPYTNFTAQKDRYVATGSPYTNFTAAVLLRVLRVSEKGFAVLPRVLRVQTSQLLCCHGFSVCSEKVSLCCHGFSVYKLHSCCVATGSPCANFTTLSFLWET
jgi:hypothetical protein